VKGWNAVNASEVAWAKDTGLSYYQIWDGPEWKLNDGPQGLRRLDNIVETAGRYDIKLIVAFANNWVGYGGADLYVSFYLAFCGFVFI
jgi:mannan endo-1,4-beta-mannosidase